MDKSLDYPSELNINLFNNIQRLSRNVLLDMNITKKKKDEVAKFELKTNQIAGGQFLLYFQGKEIKRIMNFKNDWF